MLVQKQNRNYGSAILALTSQAKYVNLEIRITNLLLRDLDQIVRKDHELM